MKYNEIPKKLVSKSDAKSVKEVCLGFYGDSGDGVQLIGDRIARTAVINSLSIMTHADFPAEIRAPAGTVAGVSGIHVNLSEKKINTPGSSLDYLFAFNPAALKVGLADASEETTYIINEDGFTDKAYEKAGLNPNEFDHLNLISIPITSLTVDSLGEFSLLKKARERPKNFFALGLFFWILELPTESLFSWLEKKFKQSEVTRDSNAIAFFTGWNYLEDSPRSLKHLRISKNKMLDSDNYTCIDGNKALVAGLMAASNKSGRGLFFGGYPITPASSILQEFSALSSFGVKFFQAEDEIAAVGSAIGASYAGSLGVTATSGPGFVLKQEFLNFAVMAELPLVVIDVQRAGPSTGMPTKTEQSDLLLAMYGRNGDSPVVVIAPRSPGDCFKSAYEACRIATKYMTPVVLLSDGYLATNMESWSMPDLSEFRDFEIIDTPPDKDNYQPYKRNPHTLARPWVVPGTHGLEHRIGGLEKEDEVGDISYRPENHETMVHFRNEKVNMILNDIVPIKVFGNTESDILVVSWGSTFGAVTDVLNGKGAQPNLFAHLHLRFLNPLPVDFASVLARYKKVISVENSDGQFATLLGASAGRHIYSHKKIQGQPYTPEEIAQIVYEVQKVEV